MDFNYDVAFSRNIGWVTHDEQASLRTKRVAIAGCGGVGGLHSLTLARLGVGKINISDFDQFDIHNINRQSGAFVSTKDQDKIEVMSAMLKDINPEIEIGSFPLKVLIFAFISPNGLVILSIGLLDNDSSPLSAELNL